MCGMILDSESFRQSIAIHFSIHHLLRLKDWHDNELQLLNEYAQHFITHFVFENKDEMGYSFSREAFNTLNSNVKTIVMDQLFENLKLHFAIPQNIR